MTLIIIMSLSVLIISLSKLSFSTAGLVKRVETELVLEGEHSKIVNEFVSELIKDKTPLADSVFDIQSLPGFKYEEGQSFHFENSDSVDIKLEELSSRLNPNIDDISFWKDTQLKSRSLFSKISSQKKAFVKDREECEWLPYEEDWEKFYTLYSPININNTSDESLKMYLTENLSGNSDVVDILNDWSSLHADSYNIHWDDLDEILESQHAFPLLWAEPSWNINLMDQDLLRYLVHYPWNGEGFKDPIGIVNKIKTERNRIELYEEDLKKIIVNEDDHVTEHFLACFGEKTAFWKLSVYLNTSSSTTILYRIPNPEHPEIYRMQIVSQEIYGAPNE
jgi:hypothetical protein